MSNKISPIAKTTQPNTKPLVSVILPTYNRAKFVCEAIDSIISQTFTNIEIIVVDDGSKDNTKDILKKYKDKIKYIYQENKGPGSARNRGIKEATGKYIAFLDSDDIWMDFKLELQVDILEKLKSVGLLFSDFRILKDVKTRVPFGLKQWQKRKKPWNEIFSKSIDFSSLIQRKFAQDNEFEIFLGNLYYPLLCEPYVPTCSALVRRKCINETRKFPEGVFLYEDWEFFARLSREYEVAFMNIETFYNRGHKDDTRLTYCSEIKKAENRLSLIERVWKQDGAFFKKFRKEIAEIEGEQLLILAKENLFKNKQTAARRLLAQRKQLELSGENMIAIFVRIVAYIPYGSILLGIVRSIRMFFLKKFDAIG